MKKLLTFALAFALSLSLVACGGPDKQPAIDALNAAGHSFNEVADQINANLSIYPQDLIDELNELAAAMNEKSDLLSSDAEMTEEELNDIITLSAEIETWAAETKVLLDEYESTYVDVQPIHDAYASAAAAYNEVVDYMNANIDQFSQEDIDTMTEIGEVLTEYATIMEDVFALDQETVDLGVSALNDIEEWALEVKAALGI